MKREGSLEKKRKISNSHVQLSRAVPLVLRSLKQLEMATGAVCQRQKTQDQETRKTKSHVRKPTTESSFFFFFEEERVTETQKLTKVGERKKQ